MLRAAMQAGPILEVSPSPLLKVFPLPPQTPAPAAGVPAPVRASSARAPRCGPPSSPLSAASASPCGPVPGCAGSSPASICRSASARCRAAGSRCHKHPSTKTATRSFRNTKSGLPKKRCCRRQPVIPSARISLTSASSVALFPRDRTRLITSERLAFVKTSDMNHLPPKVARRSSSRRRSAGNSDGVLQTALFFGRLRTEHSVPEPFVTLRSSKQSIALNRSLSFAKL